MKFCSVKMMSDDVSTASFSEVGKMNVLLIVDNCTKFGFLVAFRHEYDV